MKSINLKSNTFIYILLFIMIFIISVFVSCYSPLYDISFLNYDSSVFYLIGKGMKDGYIPYIDLADHKGIYIFFVNYLGALISENHYIGIFIVNILINYIFALMIYKILTLFCSNRIVNFFTTMTIFVIATSYFFCHGGMKCETMLAPIILLVYYTYLKCLVSENENNYKLINIYIMGIAIGIVLFTKANMCICFLPVIIMLIKEIVKSKKYQLMFVYFIVGLVGILTSAMPAITFGIFTNSIKEMFYYTFTVNLIYSKGLYYKYRDIVDAITSMAFEFRYVLISCILSLCISWKLIKNKKVVMFLIMTFIANAFSSFVALRPYSYHAYILLFNIMWLMHFVYMKLYEFLCKKRLIGIVAMFILIILSVPYMYFFSYSRNINQGYKQYLVNKKMEQHYKAGETILVLGEAIGVYNYFDTYPIERNFCTPHIERRLIEPVYRDLLDDIESVKSDWVIASYTPLMLKSNFAKEAEIALSKNYDYVDDIPLAPATIYRAKNR